MPRSCGPLCSSARRHIPVPSEAIAERARRAAPHRRRAARSCAKDRDSPGEERARAPRTRRGRHRAPPSRPSRRRYQRRRLHRSRPHAARDTTVRFEAGRRRQGATRRCRQLAAFRERAERAPSKSRPSARNGWASPPARIDGRASNPGGQEDRVSRGLALPTEARSAGGAGSLFSRGARTDLCPRTPRLRPVRPRCARAGCTSRHGRCGTGFRS